MAMFGTQQGIDDVTVIGEQDEPFGVAIEPPYRKHAFGMADKVDDVAGNAPIGGAFDADRFMQGQVNLAACRLSRQAVHGYLVTK